MRKIYLYDVADDYIQYLSQFDQNIFDAKIGNRSYGRKYIGVVLEMNGCKYFAPLSSPKPKDFNADGSIREDTNWLIRIKTRNKDGKLECKGKINFSKMIPVPESAVRRFDIAREKNRNYRTLLIKEIDFIVKNRAKIYRKAIMIYRQKMAEKSLPYAPKYLEWMANLSLLEEKCLAYKKLSKFKQNQNIQLKAGIQDQGLNLAVALVPMEPAPVLMTAENY